MDFGDPSVYGSSRRTVMRPGSDGPTDDRTAPASFSIRTACQPGAGGAELQAEKSTEPARSMASVRRPTATTLPVSFSTSTQPKSSAPLLTIVGYSGTNCATPWRPKPITSKTAPMRRRVVP